MIVIFKVGNEAVAVLLNPTKEKLIETQKMIKIIYKVKAADITVKEVK